MPADRAPLAGVAERPPADWSALSDEELVQWAVAGHEGAYRDLVRRYQGPIFRFLSLMVRDREQAEDLTQQTLIKVLGSLKTYRGDGKLSSWIRKIAKRVALDHLRAARRERQALERAPLEITPGRTVAMGTAPDAPSDSLPTRPDLRELRAALEQAIAGLREVQRMCLIMRDLEERSYDDIAETLDLPVGTVSTYVNRARRQLRHDLAAVRDAARGNFVRDANPGSIRPSA